jgi:hypothetical protein
VGEESKIPSVVTPEARMAKKAFKTFNNNNGVQRSTQVKYLVQRLTYDGLVVHHYAYMVKIIQEVELVLNKRLETLNGIMSSMKIWWRWMLMLFGNW